MTAQPGEAPSADGAMRAFNSIRSWLDGWSVPATAGANELPDAEGACVTLRLDGKVIGRATEVAIGPADDRGRVVHRAVVGAYSEADKRAPIEHDALRNDRLRALGPRVMISVELAGPLTPVSPETTADLDGALAVGLDGLAVGIGNRLEAMFPGAMMASNSTPSEALRPLIARLTDQPAQALLEPRELSAQSGVKFYKFRVTHLAQCGAGEPPVFLHRGVRLVPASEVSSRAGLARFADMLAANLMHRRYAGSEPLGMHGTYLPGKGQYLPVVADAAEQALAALALARYSGAGPVSPEQASRASAEAVRIIADLHRVAPSETSPYEDPATCALILAAMQSSERLRALPESALIVGAGVKGVRDAFDPQKGFASDTRPGAMAALALGEVCAPWLLAKDPENEVAAILEALNTRARPAIRRAFKEVPAANLISAMPFLGWAELETVVSEKAEVPAAAALRQMRTAYWSLQVRETDTMADRVDAIGGVLFTRRPGALPDWNMVRPLAFIATMLGDERLTPAPERSQELARIIAAVRFMRQLTADDSIGWMAADVGTARGGVRLAGWDWRMPVDATAMTLLMVVETMRSLDLLAPPAAPAAPPTP